MADKAEFTTPVGRIVQGDLYSPQTADAEGKPLVVKSGPNIGQPRVDYFFALAIPKGNEDHWARTEWGAKIWAIGHGAFPAQAQSRAFAWKVKDGDSTEPNRVGRKPCDQEGFKGCWILNFSGGYAPKVCNSDGSAYLLEKNAVKPGYYVQVLGSCTGNGSTQQPGVFLNHSIVSLQGYGPVIAFGPDAASAGFGKAALPPGASATPIGGMTPPPAPAPAVAVTPAPTPMAAPPILGPAAAVAPAITPHPGFLLGGAPATSAAPPPPPATAAPVAPTPPARVITPKAQGATYEQLIAAGWTDQLLVQHGMMLQ
jgi:hypothetical protein